jgi:hypothetical protein
MAVEDNWRTRTEGFGVQNRPNAGTEIQIDEKEMRERAEAAAAYAGETPDHFVNYCLDCVDLSVKAMLDIRLMQEELWKIFNEEEPDNWGLKEMWMSRITYPKPNKYVRVGGALARKAFDVDFLSIENEKDPAAAQFWKDFMGLMVTRNYANFPVQFSDATAMALAVGTSMEIIPIWNNSQGLELLLIPPENIHRDPAAESRKPWSGRYWIHQEWQPYYLLKKGQDDGIYQSVTDFATGGGWISSPNLTEEEIARRKNMVHTQGAFVNTVMTSEFWGTVIGPTGEMLLPRATFTIAANRIIRPPRPSPYPSLRWPGIGFSALPNLRRFDGRGLLQGIRGLWYFANNLLSLHADNLNWVVNPMLEVNTDAMVNPLDNEVFPGKVALVYETQSGQKVVRVVERNTQNNDIIAMMSKADMMMDDGAMIDRTVQGAPGYRSYVTAKEAEQNLEQSSNIIGAIATDIEDGALNVIAAMAETAAINMTFDELNKWFPEYAAKYRVPAEESPTMLRLPKLSTGNFKIAGIAAFMKHQENLQNLEKMEELFTEGSVFLPYLKPYPYLKARVKYTNLVDIGMLVGDDDAKRIDDAQQAQQEAAVEAMKAKQAAEAQVPAAQAHEIGAEGDKHLAQAGLFGAKAGAIPPGGEGAPPTPEGGVA